MIKRPDTKKFLFIALATMLFVSGCSRFQPPDPNGPRSNAPPYPIVSDIDVARREESMLAWRRLSPQYGMSGSEPTLQPETATLQSLPANSNVLLPKVGAGPTQSEEEIRESLRRFIADWRQLIGADPTQLSLVERKDEPSGIKLARYEQRPFRYPLRGAFGNLVIRFAPNRKVIELMSNCIPNTERLQAALAQLTPKVSAEDLVTHIKAHQINVGDLKGRQQNFTVAASDPVEVKQLVVYATPAGENALELHLAWEVVLPDAPLKTLYWDAVEDRALAAN